MLANKKIIVSQERVYYQILSFYLHNIKKQDELNHLVNF